MHKILLTPEGSLIPSQAPEYSNVCMKRLSYLDVLIAPLEKRNLFRLIYHAPERLEDYSQVPDDYGKNLIEYQEYEVDVMTFYCDSVAWDGNPETRDETGDGTKENPWRNVNYALERIQPSLDCTEKLCCYRPIYQLLIKGTINYMVGNKATSSIVFYRGYGRLVLDAWSEESGGTAKWEVANVPDSYGVSNINGAHIYNCYVHNLEYSTGTSYGFNLNSNAGHPTTFHGCRVAYLSSVNSVGFYVSGSKTASVMVYDCHVSDLSSQHLVTGFIASGYIYEIIPSALMLNCSAKDMEVIKSDTSYSRIAYGFQLYETPILARCKVENITVQSRASLGDGLASGFYSTDDSDNHAKLSECTVENLRVIQAQGNSFYSNTRAYGCQVHDGNFYHCSFNDIFAELAIGVFVEDTDWNTPNTSTLYYCKASKLSGSMKVYGFSIPYSIFYACEVSNCESLGNMETYRKEDDFTWDSFGTYGFYCGDSTLISCKVSDLRAHSNLYGIFTEYTKTWSSDDKTYLFDCTIENCSCTINNAGRYTNIKTYGVYQNGFSMYIYNCSISNLRAISSSGNYYSSTYGFYQGRKNLLIEIYNCSISNLRAISLNGFYTTITYGISLSTSYSVIHDCDIFDLRSEASEAGSCDLCIYGIYSSSSMNNNNNVNVRDLSFSYTKTSEPFSIGLYSCDIYQANTCTGNKYCKKMYKYENGNYEEYDC